MASRDLLHDGRRKLIPATRLCFCKDVGQEYASLGVAFRVNALFPLADGTRKVLLRITRKDRSLFVVAHHPACATIDITVPVVAAAVIIDG